MEITIYRGTHQIGGCATEIKTSSTRILIDFGSELPKEDGFSKVETLGIKGVTEAPCACDGVFFTHTHGDHIGNIGRILPDIPIYLGSAARKIAERYYKHCQASISRSKHISRYYQKELEALKVARPYTEAEPIKIGDIAVTPFRVDHSSFDSYSLLIEAEGKRILHTGDFRTHGFTGDNFFHAIEHHIGNVDALITEGTLLSRVKERIITEQVLSEKAEELLQKENKVFVFCSSTNIDRFVAFHKAAKKLKVPCFCDAFQKQLLDIVTKHDVSEDGVYSFDEVEAFAYNKKPELPKRFLVFVRDNGRLKYLMDYYKNNSLVIYSMWKGYLERESTKAFLKDFRSEILHTSGHATCSDIQKLLELTKPRIVIPIHIENPELFRVKFPEINTIKAEDGESIYI